MKGSKYKSAVKTEARRETALGFLPAERWKRFLIWLAVWTVIALVSVPIFYFSRVLPGRVAPWTLKLLIIGKLGIWYGWGFLTALIFYIAQRIHITRESWFKPILIHLAFSILFVGIYLLWYTAIIILMAGQQMTVTEETITIFKELTANQTTFYFLTYWVIVLLSFAIDFQRRLKEQELLLTQSKLKLLKAQLHPHFMFNTLQLISTLMHENVDKADSVLEKLSDMLRISLVNADVQETSLSEELEFIELYLDIQRGRFQDRLTVEVNVQTELLNLQVPSLLLQPLVENAVRHGVSSHSEQALIKISACKRNGLLELRVEDNGPGLPKNWSEEQSMGIGLSNTIKRLEQLYGTNQSLEFQSPVSGGLTVVVKIPYRERTRGSEVIDRR